MRQLAIHKTFRSVFFATLMSLAIPPCHAESTRSPDYTGYQADGRTSASVLSAKRSHAVSDRDKIGLGLYSGIIVIGVILFFARQRSDK